MSSISGAHYQADVATAVADGGKQKEMDLLRRARSGDRAAYGQIVVSYQDRLYNAMLRMVGNEQEAQELTQETFVRGLCKIETFRGEASAYTWLFRIAVNLVISQLRKVQRHRTYSLEAAGGNGRFEADQASGLLDRVARDPGEQPVEVLQRRERQEHVVAALGRLEAEYRAVLVMRDIEGFDYQQMADILGLPLGTLKSRLFRARLALRDELKAYMFDGQG
jgi:RNA polymerase sigma-70 factor (ECF subfamily)